MLLLLTQPAAPAHASGPASLGTTPWQISFDPVIYANPQSGIQVHGDPGEYGAAPAIPPVDAPVWADCGPGVTRCPNPTTIGMAVGSILPGCWTGLNFTFFQSLVSIPTGTTISQFSVDMSGADDGARISLVNSAYPGGVTPQGGYIYQGTPQSTANLSDYVVAGEVNRVIVTQVDDCASGNNLNSAAISLNGTVVPVKTPTTTSVSFGSGPFVYTGSAFTATATVDPSGAGTASVTYSGDCVNPGNTCTATATYAGDATYLGSSDSQAITIDPPTQTLSILGGSTGGGGIGVPDASTDWSQDPVAWDGGITSTGAWHFTGNPSPVWHPAYLVGAHPWGFVPGTDSWINCGPTTASIECGNSGGTVVAFRVRFTIPDGSINPNITFWINSDNAGTYYINGTQVTDRLVGGPGTGANPVGPSGCVSGSAPYCPAGVHTAALQSALHSGENEMLVVVEDWGGAAGFNYRADLTVQGFTPPVIIPPKTATTTTVSFGAGPFVYNGSAFTATATVAPDGGTADIVYTGDCVNAGSTCTATATYAGDDTHEGSTGTATITIDKAPSTTTVTGGGTFTYDGTNHPLSATVTGAGGLNQPVAVADCVVAPTDVADSCVGTATYAGDANHTGSSDTAALTITSAPSTTTVVGDGTFVYDATAHRLTATVTGVGGLNESVPVLGCGSAPTNVADSCTGTATYAGDANHSGSSATGTVTITRAPSTTTVSGGGSFTYDGSGHPLTATVTGIGGLNQAVPVVGCGPNPTLPADDCTGTATFPGDANHLGSTDSASVTITIDYVYPAGGVFVVGDQAPHGLLSSVTFWGSQWAKRNSLSGGGAPASFKGFENTVAAPSCGSTWTTAPGNSAGPPATVGQYIAVVVASKISKKGSTITGNVAQIIIVKTDAGYGPSPGHAGSGTVLQVLCSAS